MEAKTPRFGDSPREPWQENNPVVEKFKESVESVKNQGSKLTSSAVKKADQMAVSAGHGLRSVAAGLRDHSPGGTLGDASQQIAATLQSSGQYLEDHGLTGLADDMTALVRRNPIPALFVALGVGFVIARATSARS